jgi:hypothetical protein
MTATKGATRAEQAIIRNMPSRIAPVCSRYSAAISAAPAFGDGGGR